MEEISYSKERNLYNTSFFHRIFPNMIAGGLAGSMTDIIFFPLETLKTRLQASSKFLKVSLFSNLFKGITPQLTITFPAASTYFIGYEGTKFVLDNQMIPNNLSITQKAFFGGISAETLRVIICCPFEIVKQQLQVGQQTRMTEAFGYMLRSAGFRSFYRGFWSLLFREIPFSCIQMPIYEVVYMLYFSHYLL